MIVAGLPVDLHAFAKRMAKDVDAALHEIIVKAGGRTPEQAKEYGLVDKVILKRGEIR